MWGIPDMPQSLAYLWVWFIKLHNSRSIGMVINPISFQEILAFCQLYKVIMLEWEVDLICELDRVAMKELQKDK